MLELGNQPQAVFARPPGRAAGPSLHARPPGQPPEQARARGERASLNQACSRACAGVTRCAGLNRSMSSSRPMAALPRWKLRAALPAGDAALRARSARQRQRCRVRARALAVPDSSCLRTPAATPPAWRRAASCRRTHPACTPHALWKLAEGFQPAAGKRGRRPRAQRRSGARSRSRSDAPGRGRRRGRPRGARLCSARYSGRREAGGCSGARPRTPSVFWRQCGSCSSSGHAPASGAPSTRKILPRATAGSLQQSSSASGGASACPFDSCTRQGHADDERERGQRGRARTCRTGRPGTRCRAACARRPGTAAAAPAARPGCSRLPTCRPPACSAARPAAAPARGTRW